MNDDEVRAVLTPTERWAFDRAARNVEVERKVTSNQDGSPRITFVAGPWDATVSALRTVAHLRSASEAMATALRSRLHEHMCECAYCEGNRDLRGALDIYEKATRAQ